MRVDGIKWISSFPENIKSGIPRASAVLVLNDYDTGYPFACLESSIISAARTAASAALATDWLTRERVKPRRLGFVGAGLIARHIHTYLVAAGWDFEEVGVYDLSAENAAAFRSYLAAGEASVRVSVRQDAEDLVRSSDLVVFATVAAQPHVRDPRWFAHNPLVLNVSLRDLAPEVLLESANVLDDVEHCLKAGTSPHLTEQLTGSRDFVDGTLADVMAGSVRVPADRPVVFSPFGLGVLDLAVGKSVYDRVRADGDLRVVEDFFHELDRYGVPGHTGGPSS
ncbi:2,3-diaminopropionate biosynthesis protein SbnB [Streptomyces sodiiphilus]|uniref:2,3-diaminopropionate biosynthesis protein SbnB n=1 Tax=Streptomyces sodiiphilus TaxID=226217 RepID=A0ABN2PSS7_9ACTN